jgi:hypothetical protein
LEVLNDPLAKLTVVRIPPEGQHEATQISSAISRVMDEELNSLKHKEFPGNRPAAGSLALDLFGALPIQPFCSREGGAYSVASGKDNEMRYIETVKAHKAAISGTVLIGLLMFVSTFALSRGPKTETIEASAMGTGTQMGAVIGVTLDIYEWSTPEDRQILIEAFTKGQNQGLVNALSKMKAVGHCSITGTLGYDVSYIRMVPTPTGRKIVFVTNRQIRFGEAFFDTQSQSFNLTAGEFELNSTDKSKSTGAVYPATQLIIDKQGQLQYDLRENPWKLVDVLDWQGTPGVN